MSFIEDTTKRAADDAISGDQANTNTPSLTNGATSHPAAPSPPHSFAQRGASDLEYTRHYLKVLEFTKDRKQQTQDPETFLQKSFGAFGKIKRIVNITASSPQQVAEGKGEGVHLGYIIEFRRPRRVQSDPKRQTFYTQMSVPEQILRKVLQSVDALDGAEYQKHKEGYVFHQGTEVFADHTSVDGKMVARGHIFSGYNRFLVEGRIDQFEGAAREDSDDADSSNEKDDAEPFDLYAGAAEEKDLVGEEGEGKNTASTANRSSIDHNVSNNANNSSTAGGKLHHPSYVPSAPPACIFLTLAPLPIPPEHAATVLLPTVSPYTVFQILRHLCLPNRILILGDPQQQTNANKLAREGHSAQPVVHKALVELSNAGELAMVCDRIDRTEVELCEEVECRVDVPAIGAKSPESTIAIRSSNDYAEALATGNPAAVPPPVRTVISARYFVAAAPSMQHEGRGLTVGTNTGRSMTICTKLPSLFLPQIDVLPGAPTVISTAEALGAPFDRTLTPMVPPIGPYNPITHHSLSMRKYTDPFLQDELRRHDVWRAWTHTRKQSLLRSGGGDTVQCSKDDDPEDVFNTYPQLPEVSEPSYDIYDPLCQPGREEDLKQAIRDMRTYVLRGRRRSVPPGKTVPPSRLTIGAHIVEELPIPPQPSAEELEAQQQRHQSHRRHSTTANANDNASATSNIHSSSLRSGGGATNNNKHSPRPDVSASCNTASNAASVPNILGIPTITIGGVAITPSPMGSFSDNAAISGSSYSRLGTNDGPLSPSFNHNEKDRDNSFVSERARRAEQRGGDRGDRGEAGRRDRDRGDRGERDSDKGDRFDSDSKGDYKRSRHERNDPHASALLTAMATNQQQHIEGPMASLLPDLVGVGSVSFSDILNDDALVLPTNTEETAKTPSDGLKSKGHGHGGAVAVPFFSTRANNNTNIAGTNNTNTNSQNQQEIAKANTGAKTGSKGNQNKTAFASSYSTVVSTATTTTAAVAEVGGGGAGLSNATSTAALPTQQKSYPSIKVKGASWEEYFDSTHQRSYYCLRSASDESVLETTWERPEEMGVDPAAVATSLYSAVNNSQPTSYSNVSSGHHHNTNNQPAAQQGGGRGRSGTTSSTGGGGGRSRDAHHNTNIDSSYASDDDKPRQKGGVAERDRYSNSSKSRRGGGGGGADDRDDRGGQSNGNRRGGGGGRGGDGYGRSGRK